MNESEYKPKRISASEQHTLNQEKKILLIWLQKADQEWHRIRNAMDDTTYETIRKHTQFAQTLKLAVKMDWLINQCRDA